MDISQINETTPPGKPLRLWPGVVAAGVLILARFVVPVFIPEATIYGMGIGALAVLAIGVWWLFFSRAPWLQRIGAIVLIVITLFVTSRLIHVSIRTGAMGFLFPVLSLPVVSVTLVAWAVATRRLSAGFRRALLVISVMVACGGFTLLRTGGFTGDFEHDFAWRWSKTPEDRLLAQVSDEPTALPAHMEAREKGTDWPGFRGLNRDGIVRGSRINADWSSLPPVELWRRPIGPGWSSFAVSGNRVYTQEQRGNDEIVASYDLTSGKPIWRHRDAARFWESNAGAGPRATPTLSNGRVYSFGATGIVNALNADTGEVIWSRNAASDTQTKIPGWGFSSSPLVVDDVVIIATAGTLVAYDGANGERRWLGPAGGGSYSSPHLATIGGVPQVLLLNGLGVISVSPVDGKLLWEYQLSNNGRICQPALIEEGEVLVHDGEGNAMRRIAVAHGLSGWAVAERWDSYGLNPYFNDFVVHDGHAFGFTGSSIACIDLQNGERKWKGGSYGHGQLILLSDQDLLLVLSEDGELAVVKATPDQFAELARIPAIKGKTWNHPVLVGDVLLVRNGEEMAAFRLPMASS